MESDKEDLLAAEHQLLGFFHAKNGYSLDDLITGMGLTAEEFQELRDTGALSNLTWEEQEDIVEILIKRE